MTEKESMALARRFKETCARVDLLIWLGGEDPSAPSGMLDGLLEDLDDEDVKEIAAAMGVGGLEEDDLEDIFSNPDVLLEVALDHKKAGFLACVLFPRRVQFSPDGKSCEVLQGSSWQHFFYAEDLPALVQQVEAKAAELKASDPRGRRPGRGH